MRGQPPLVWERAEDIFVYDKYGNRWLDWSSGVLVANAGHGAPEIRDAILGQVNSGLLHNYCFPSEERAQLVEALAGVAPDGLKKVFLLTTGSEAVECAIKLARARGIQLGGEQKIGIVGFDRGFHGRTLGSQQIGGLAAQKSWIVNLDPAIIHAPFPDGYWQPDIGFGTFLEAVARAGFRAGTDRGRGDGDLPRRGAGFRAGGLCPRIGGVVPAPWRGAGSGRGPGGFRPHRAVLGLRALRRDARLDLLRQGHQQFVAPLGRDRTRGDHGPIRPRLDDQHAHRQSRLLRRGPGQPEEDPGREASRQRREARSRAACRPERRFSQHTLASSATVNARGLVGGMQTVEARQGTHHDLAHAIIERCFWKGLLFFAPVGAWGQTVKVCPPLTMPRDALEEGLAVLSEATDEAVAALYSQRTSE